MNIKNIYVSINNFLELELQVVNTASKMPLKNSKFTNNQKVSKSQLSASFIPTSDYYY